MPPKTRARTTKSSKENIGVLEKSKPKTKPTKPRKALADKTNSASDDNASVEITKNVLKKTVSKVVETALENTERPRRERRLPNRYVENQVLTSLSNSKEFQTPKSASNKNRTPSKNDTTISPSKTPQKDVDNSLIAPRPKRICRLPSKFDKGFESPNKFIPDGCCASTPILSIKTKSDSIVSQKPTSQNLTSKSNKPTSQRVAKQPNVHNEKSPHKTSVVKASDTNNNAKQRLLKSKAIKHKLDSPENKTVKTAGQKLLEKSFSFRVLEDKKLLKRDSGHLDVYEFTYDPNEEPPPQKKKRKKAVKKKPAKPKTVVFKNNYDQNVNKALEALKNVVSKNKTQQVVAKPAVLQNQPQNLPKPQIIVTDTAKNTETENVIDNNHVSIGIEDIAADIEPLTDHHEINYSPVTSPHHGISPTPLSSTQNQEIDRPLVYNDPLNLQEDFSFFDEPPVASSSMNMSVRRPHASPWRVQFEQLPIKWQVNTYVKANMTPAVESSFINFDENKKKHVYTNMVAQADEELPEIVENNQPYLKQTSIISFIKDVVQRSASKKKRARSVTPTKANSLFEDISNISVHTNRDTVHKTPRKTPRIEAPECSTPQESARKSDSNSSKSNTEDKENSNEGKKKKSLTPGKSSKKKNKDGTFFGFDESEDQENMSPVKIDNPRVRALRPRARAVLQEINAQTGPSRAKIPLAAKTKIAASSEAVNQAYENMKSASDAPEFLEKNVDVAATDVAENMNAEELDDDDSQSVHLFEDIELVHHLKPTRKSYGKSKKVTFRQTSTSDSETRANDGDFEPDSGEEDDLADLTFTMPTIEQKSKPKKKAKPKKQLSKKEKAELEAWAAGFNSMCEDIEEFPLMVE